MNPSVLLIPFGVHPMQDINAELPIFMWLVVVSFCTRMLFILAEKYSKKRTSGFNPVCTRAR